MRADPGSWNGARSLHRCHQVDEFGLSFAHDFIEVGRFETERRLEAGYAFGV